MKKKFLLCSALLTITMISMTGCGSNSSNETASNDSTKAPAAVASSSPSDGGSVMQDAEDAVEDIGNGVGDAVKDVGNGVGDAVNDVTNP